MNAMLLVSLLALGPDAGLSANVALPAPPAPNHPAWLYGAATLGIAAAALADHSVQHEATEHRGSFSNQLADDVRGFGTPAVLAPALALGMIGGQVFHRPDVSGGSFRVAASVGVSAVACVGIKWLVGRERPMPSNGDMDEFRPLSGDDSFPSGHTTIAFAAASGVDRETRAHWVPWVVYPMASLVGWSRVNDDRHWASDVVAGAFLGIWSAHEVEEVAHGHRAALGTVVSVDPHSMRLGLSRSF